MKFALWENQLKIENFTHFYSDIVSLLVWSVKESMDSSQQRMNLLKGMINWAFLPRIMLNL